MDGFSIFFGVLLGILLLIILDMIMTNRTSRVKQITIPSDIANDIVGETPYCPKCNSSNLKLIDDNAQVSFLKGRIPELDHYQCQKCYETFSDEDWKNVKVYSDVPSGDD